MTKLHGEVAATKADVELVVEEGFRAVDGFSNAYIHKTADGQLEVATTTMETEVIEIAKLNGEVTVAKGDVALIAEEGFTAVDGFSNVYIRKTADGKFEVATATMEGATLVSVK